MASSRPRRARAPPPAKRRPINRMRVAAGGGRGEGEMAAPWGRTSRFVRPLSVHPQQPPSLGRPRRPHTRAPKGPRRFDQIARSRFPLGVQVVFEVRCSGGVASLDPRLISVIPTGIAGRDFVTPNDRTLFSRHPLARDPPHVVPCGSPGAPAHGASRRIGKRRTAPYSRLGGAAASQANGPASAGWWKRPGRIQLPL